MKKLLLFCTGLYFSLCCIGQDYIKHVQSNHNPNVYAHHYLDPDGSVLVVSVASSTLMPNAPCEFNMIKINASGQLLWRRNNTLSYFSQGTPFYPRDVTRLPNGNYQVAFTVGSYFIFSFYMVEVDGNTGIVTNYRNLPGAGINVTQYGRKLRQESGNTRLALLYGGNGFNPTDTTLLLKVGNGLSMQQAKLVKHGVDFQQDIIFTQETVGKDVVAIQGLLQGIRGTMLITMDLLWQTSQAVWLPGIEITDGLEMPSGELYYSFYDTLGFGVLVLNPDLSLKWCKQMPSANYWPFCSLMKKGGLVYLYNQTMPVYKHDYFAFDAQGNLVNAYRVHIGAWWFPQPVRSNPNGHTSIFTGFQDPVLMRLVDLTNTTVCGTEINCAPVITNRPVVIIPKNVSLIAYTPSWNAGSLVSHNSLPVALVDTCFPASVTDPLFQLDTDTICLGDSVWVKDYTNNQGAVTWTLNGQQWIQTADSFWWAPPVPGNYTIQKITHMGFCVDSFTLSLTVLSLPVVNFPDTILCSGTILTLTNPGTDLITWPDGSTGNTYSTNQPGNYTVGVSNGSCSSVSGFQVDVVDAGFTVSEDALCEGDSLYLQSNVPLAGQWLANGQVIQGFSMPDGWYLPPAPGTYWIEKIIQTPGCTDTFSVSITVFPLPVYPAFSDTVLCNGGIVTYTYAGPDLVTWPDGSHGNSFSTGISGIKQLVVTNGACTVQHNWNIAAVTLPQDFLPEDTVICKGAILNLYAPAGNFFFLWEDTSDVPVRTVSDSNRYILTIYNAHCITTDSIHVDTEICPDCNLFIPNAFTPDGDHHNPVFLPVTNCRMVENYALYIYNRWGQEIFFSNQLDIGWNGENAPVGVYVYRVSATLFNGLHDFAFEETGKVMLLR